jgi:hypothetical protein
VRELIAIAIAVPVVGTFGERHVVHDESDLLDARASEKLAYALCVLARDVPEPSHDDDRVGRGSQRHRVRDVENRRRVDEDDVVGC